MNETPTPLTSNENYRDPERLRTEIMNAIGFYYPRSLDRTDGGYVSGFRDDGTPIGSPGKHLVGTARYIYIYSVGALLDGPSWCGESAEHGLRFLLERQWDETHGGFYTEMEDARVKDSSKFAYGHAFVLLAASNALMAGCPSASLVMERVLDVLEQRFYDPQHGLYRDKFSEDWSEPDAYRGQNANMHLTEAFLTAYEATGDTRYLDRAFQLADTVARTLAGRTGGIVWEHYTQDWEPDYTYNQGETKDEFRPYGVIPGHQFEWSKLLMWLYKHRPESWMKETSVRLYRFAWEKGHDEQHGGLFFSLSPEYEVIDADKNYWVLSEAIAASAFLGALTGEPEWLDRYDELFRYCSDHLIDHEYGGWFQLLDRKNRKQSDEKSPSPKTDYHPVAACYQAYRLFTEKDFTKQSK